MDQGVCTIIIPSVITAQIAHTGPALCAFTRGVFGAEAEETSAPGFDSGGGDNGGRRGDIKTVMCATSM